MEFFFDRLCTKYNKSKWFGALGVLSFFIGQIICIGILISAKIFRVNEMILKNDISYVSINEIPFGIVFCVVVYIVLKLKWQKEAEIKINNIDNIGKEKTE